MFIKTGGGGNGKKKRERGEGGWGRGKGERRVFWADGWMHALLMVMVDKYGHEMRWDGMGWHGIRLHGMG